MTLTSQAVSPLLPCAIRASLATPQRVYRYLPFGNGKRYLLMDRDGKFCRAFKTMLANESLNPVQLPPKSPNLNAHLGPFFASLKSEALDRMILFGENPLRRALHDYLAH